MAKGRSNSQAGISRVAASQQDTEKQVCEAAAVKGIQEENTAGDTGAGEGMEETGESIPEDSGYYNVSSEIQEENAVWSTDAGMDAGDSEAEDGGEDGQPKELIAVYPILYLAKQYKIGEKLPANDPEMVQAWVDAGTAVWTSEREGRPKAKPAAAAAGLFGRAAFSGSEDGDNLAGRIPTVRAGRR